jgi:hypothetical protein
MAKMLRFTYAAIKRHGCKNWHPQQGGGVIEINPTYVVSVSECGTPELIFNDQDTPFVIELSNGTKILLYLHAYGLEPGQDILSENGEAANSYVDAEAYERCRFYASRLNY